MAPKPIPRQALDLRGGALRIVAVADTHGHPHPAAAERIVELAPDHLLHAGDVGALSVLDDLRRLAPLSAVRGNIDALAPDLPDALAVDICDGAERLLTILLTHIALHGPKLRADAARRAADAGASMVVCGHSHVPFMGRDRGMTIFNPGSIGPKRFVLPIIFGVVEISRQRVALRHVDCETGRDWMPGG